MSAEDWESYKTKFNKTYKDESDEQIHKHVFVENLKKIADHKKKYESGEVTFSMGINAFTDHTPEEMAMRCGGRAMKKQ